MTHDQKDEAEPVEAEAMAWIIRADNGNTRLWTGDGRSALEKAAEWGQTAEPLYAADALTSRDERIAELEMEQGDFLAASRRILERGRRLEALLKEAEAVLRRTYDHIGKTPEYHRGEGAVDLMRDAGLLSARIYSTIRACKEGEG